MPFVIASQPTQQYNKIFLNPFYLGSSTQNVPTNFTISVNPPDKIQSVLSAIVTIDVWMNPSVNFTLSVNDKSCNTNSYYISTTYAGAGKSQIFFDCSNVITSSGNYKISLKASKDTGAITGWLDLTYMNNPSGILELSGTEYSPNDSATFFVQLKDNFGNPIQNGSCYMDIWYPLNLTGQHPYTIKDAPMIKALGDDGMYYYDMTAPSILGLYMLSARCSYSFDFINYYPNTEIHYYPIQQINSGTWQGNSSVLNSKEDSLYQRCDGSIAQPCNTNYTFNLTTYGTLTNISNINVYFSGEDDIAGRILIMSYWNGTNFVNLSNTLSFGGTSGATPTGYDEYLTNIIPLDSVVNNQIKLNLITSGSVRVFYNWLTLNLLSAEGTIQDVKGSSEMHITNIPQSTANIIQNMTLNTNTTNIAQAVWSWTGSIANNILNTISTAIWNFDGRNVTVDYAQISQYVWNYSNRSLTFYQVNNVSPSDIWNYASRNLTFYQVNNLTASEIWNYSQRSLTGQNLSDIASAVWNYQTRNISLFLEGVNATINFSAVAEAVWNFTNKFVDNVGNVNNVSNLDNTVVFIGGTEYQVNDNATSVVRLIRGSGTTTTYEIGASCNATLLYPNLSYFKKDMVLNEYGSGIYSESFTIPNVLGTYITMIDCNASSRLYLGMDTFHVSPKIADSVWTFVERNLTTTNFANLSASDIWNYYNRSLSDNGILQFWNYPTRNLTTDIPFEVWQYYNRTLTNFNINFTDLITFLMNTSDVLVPYLPTSSSNVYVSNTLNVTLVLPYPN